MMKTGLTATLMAGLIMSGIAFWAMTAMPQTGEIPIHWNHKGVADGFATPAEAKRFVWMIPGMSIITSLIFALALKIDPRKTNIQKSARAYMVTWIGTLILMVGVTGLVSYSMVNGVGLSTEFMGNIVPSLIVGAMSILFIILGNYLPKTKSNWFFGIRTPWTLSSEEAWAKTHRVAGRLFLIMGILGLLSAIFLPSVWQLSILVGGILIAALFSVIYSYLAWRNASDRQTTPEYME